MRQRDLLGERLAIGSLFGLAAGTSDNTVAGVFLACIGGVWALIALAYYFKDQD